MAVIDNRRRLRHPRWRRPHPGPAVSAQTIRQHCRTDHAGVNLQSAPAREPSAKGCAEHPYRPYRRCRTSANRHLRRRDPHPDFEQDRQRGNFVGMTMIVGIVTEVAIFLLFRVLRAARNVGGTGASGNCREEPDPAHYDDYPRCHFNATPTRACHRSRFRDAAAACDQHHFGSCGAASVGSAGHASPLHPCQPSA